MSKRKRDISGGIDITGGQLEVFNLILFSVLAWFTITVEAFLRRDFGERYYSRQNFFVGFWLLTFLLFFLNFFSVFFPNNEPSPLYWTVWWMYLALSAFHFWKIWVNTQVGQPKHSLYGGKSHLEPVGKLLLKGLNPLLAIIARFLGRFTLTSENYKRLDASLDVSPPFTDAEKFTKLYIEPFVVFCLFLFVPSLPSLWLFLSSISLLVFTHMAYGQNRIEELDLQDSVIEAAIVEQDMESERRVKAAIRESLTKVQERIEKEPEYIEEIRQENPSLLEALDELDIDLGAPTQAGSA